MILDEAASKRILAKVMALVKKTAGADAVATIYSSDNGNTRFAVNEITSSSTVEQHALGVTIQIGKRSATATGNQLDDASLADVVDRAVRMAKLAPENPELLPPLGPQKYKRYEGRDTATIQLAPDTRAKAAGATIAAGTGKQAIVAGFYDHQTGAHALATSAGLHAFHAWTYAAFTCTARTPDATGSGWAGASSNRAADIDAAALAGVAVDKAVRSAKPTKLDPGRYTVVLEPAAVSELLGHLIGSLYARPADEGRSFFSKAGGGNRIGEKLFPDLVTLRSNPNDATLQALPYDYEGLPLAPTTWIEKGTLKGLVYDRFWAQKQSKPPTGSPTGWALDGGTATREELIKGVKRGVLITRFWYTTYLEPQTILVTGLTRDGVFLIENGAITRPVNNFRFNESPVQMLAKCDGMTPSVVSPDGTTRVPTLRTNEFNLASISDSV